MSLSANNTDSFRAFSLKRIVFSAKEKSSVFSLTLSPTPLPLFSDPARPMTVRSPSIPSRTLPFLSPVSPPSSWSPSLSTWPSVFFPFRSVAFSVPSIAFSTPLGLSIWSRSLSFPFSSTPSIVSSSLPVPFVSEGCFPFSGSISLAIDPFSFKFILLRLNLFLITISSATSIKFPCSKFL